jgi:hypothetical protein
MIGGARGRCGWGVYLYLQPHGCCNYEGELKVCSLFDYITLTKRNVASAVALYKVQVIEDLYIKLTTKIVELFVSCIRIVIDKVCFIIIAGHCPCR